MTDQEPLRPNGLSVGNFAPSFSTKDITGKIIDLEELLKEYNGVLIDFFRGNW